MGEVKRRRPWEEEEDSIESNVQGTFMWQLILCGFITIGVFVMLNTKNSNEVRNFIHTELNRNIEIKDINAAVDYVKKTAYDYMH